MYKRQNRKRMGLHWQTINTRTAERGTPRRDLEQPEAEPPPLTCMAFVAARPAADLEPAQLVPLRLAKRARSISPDRHRADGRARAVVWASCCVGRYHTGVHGPDCLSWRVMAVTGVGSRQWIHFLCQDAHSLLLHVRAWWPAIAAIVRKAILPVRYGGCYVGRYNR